MRQFRIRAFHNKIYQSRHFTFYFRLNLITRIQKWDVFAINFLSLKNESLSEEEKNILLLDWNNQNTFDKYFKTILWFFSNTRILTRLPLKLKAINLNLNINGNRFEDCNGLCSQSFERRTSLVQEIRRQVTTFETLKSIFFEPFSLLQLNCKYASK